MDNKRVCKCPTRLQKLCCKRVIESGKDVEDIIRALEYDAELRRRMGRPAKLPNFKIKKFRPKHFKDTCVPMTPSMHQRLRYIGHCPLEPPERGRPLRTPAESELELQRLRRKRVRYFDQATAIELPTPLYVVKHTDDDKDIINVGSPNLSGENIAVQRTTTVPLVPPLPPKAGHDLYKPHSGIIVNRDKKFCPDVVAGGTGGPIPKRPLPCHMGGVCYKACNKRLCHKHNRLRKRRARLAKMAGFREPRSGRSRGGALSSCGGGMAGPRGSRGPRRRKGRARSYSMVGARDGRARAKYRKHFVPDLDDTCGLDDVQRPDHVQVPMSLKKGMFKTHSLTVVPCNKEKRTNIHYGILKGTFNMYDNKFSPRSKGKQALTMSVMAYCLAFHYHPKQWTMKLLDNLVDAGDQWYLQCLDKVHDHSAYQGICEVLPFGKKQVLALNGKRMQVLLCEPEIIGYCMSNDPMVYNLCRGLHAFFKDNRAGVLMTKVLKVVIWKDKICYYIFDPAGRNSRAYSNFVNGTAALMNVKDLNDVAEILLSRSIVEDQKFVLAPVKVLKMIPETADEDIESDPEPTQTEKAMLGYRILTANCAIVNANMHLGDKCFEDTKFRQALTIAIAAMTYAKISPPNTWYSKTLDKILRLGNKLYVDCAQPKVVIDLTLDNIPNQITIGPYTCEIIVYRERVKGQLFTTKECIFNIRTGLQDFFSREYNSGILEFNNYTMAIWRQKEMIYLFDPYPRTFDGRRTLTVGKACCMMVLNPQTLADVISMNWDYLPATTQFYIHAFKVLKLKKRQPRNQLKCMLEDEELPGAKRKRKELSPALAPGGDAARALVADVLPVDVGANRYGDNPGNPMVDEEQMGDIISLVDSIQEDYLPPIPLKYKNMPPDPVEPKIVNLDSPTVSVTQVVPPWPKPRDKTNEPPDEDPEYEPTPPPTPPPPPPPEGAEEEEEDDEEMDEETAKAKKEEEKRRKLEEEEARRKAEELPPPMPPPPPSPQGEPDEIPLVAPPGTPGYPEIETQAAADEEPVMDVDRKVLLTEDATYRFKLRYLRKKMSMPLYEDQLYATPSEELAKPNNFYELPDGTQIIRGSACVPEEETANELPFAAIMALVTSYKYTIETWSPGIVNFVVDSAKKLYTNKKERFQFAPMHIIPKIAIGKQAYHAMIDVVGEGATWQLETVLTNNFFCKYDRGMVTTSNYSAAIFGKNGLFYLFDGSCCNSMGLRDPAAKGKGHACFLRFRTIHDLACRINNNKDGRLEDQQFILSRLYVRKLLPDSRYQLPEDYDYDAMGPKSKKSKTTLVEPGDTRTIVDPTQKKKGKEPAADTSPEAAPLVGYQPVDGTYKIEGTTALTKKGGGKDVTSCHFVCLIAMLMAAMHPIRTWDSQMVDICLEKGMEIYEKATNKSVCEKRVIKNIILDGKFINVNIKKIIVVNENPERHLEQFMKAVMRRLRYVIVRFGDHNIVVCQADGYYHVFNPYANSSGGGGGKKEGKKDSKDKGKPGKRDSKDQSKPGSAAGSKTGSSTQLKDSEPEPEPEPETSKTSVVSGKGPYPDYPGGGKAGGAVAAWLLFRSLEQCMAGIRATVGAARADSPEFYTFELTSVRAAPKHAALDYKLSPLFKPDENPNLPYLKLRKVRPLVDEKMYWLNVDVVPWSRMAPCNDLGLPRRTPQTLWRSWDIEFPGDLYSVWGTFHPTDEEFPAATRGKQYLCACVVALAMLEAVPLPAWTPAVLDGVVDAADRYTEKCLAKIANTPNVELKLEDLEPTFDDMWPFTFTANFESVIFGFVYSMLPDRFNLSRALSYFFEKHTHGILVSPSHNLAFGKYHNSYFMFDCQSYGAPIFSPGQGASYMLKCESLNRLIYCMTVALNVRRHGQQFHLYSATVTLQEIGGGGGGGAPKKTPSPKTKKK